ncbi:MAG: hydroxyacid dehydrogenase [Deltaproteobacteria bacterium]|jgi:D-3-phosphoglycerate dehydrogenase/(S)-sulfolactate dehydrogenase|nr:hydroxyacid dehydrogenase [Deltaproteobacteria bacterium]
MAFNILISDKIEPVCPERLIKDGCLVDQKSGLGPEELEAIIGQYDALIVRSATKVTGKILKTGSIGKLKIVGRAGAGLDNIDLEAAKKLGIEVVNTPGLNANAVAELVVAFLIILSRKLGAAMSSIKAGRWEKKGLSGTEVMGKTIGLVGLGAVGRLVAAKAIGLGMKVLAYDPLISHEKIKEAGAEPADLEALWANSDYISLHLPKTEQTKNLVGSEALSKMRKGSFLINCARGGLVDENALHTALVEGTIAGAASDVFAQEPPGWSPLLALPNFEATPHLGASTEEAQLAVAEKVAELISGYLSSLGAK